MGTGKVTAHPGGREELNYILSSGVVDPASNPGKLLRHVCEKYFEGAAADLKERNIAIDVFHRLASFDKRSDSIVRVEAYRLRKRLAEFYAGPGHDRPMRIVIPVGQYAPVVEANTPMAADLGSDSSPPLDLPDHDPVGTLDEDSEGAQKPAPVDGAPTGRQRSGWILFLVAALLVTLVAVAWWTRAHPAARAGEAVSGSQPRSDIRTATGGGGEFRMLAGYTKDHYIDRFGHVWVGDRYFRGGKDNDRGPDTVARAFDPVLFQSRREGLDFSYDIPAKPGKYELKLYFDESEFGTNERPGGEVSRLMDVFLNDTRILRVFDVYTDAGGSKVGHIRAFRDVSPGNDGKVHLRFHALYDLAFVNAIELIPQSSSGIQPIRMLARLSPFIDRTGAVWEPDDYVVGGQLVARNEVVTGTLYPELYAGERYGHFNYAIPVPAGKYAVKLYFAERWFKQPGDRVFNVLCDGTTLLHDFDIFKEAGGQERAIVREFHHLEPNAQGLLDLSFVPVVNYALVDAIEVTSE